jgi:hypothetical protein
VISRACEVGLDDRGNSGRVESGGHKMLTSRVIEILEDRFPGAHNAEVRAIACGIAVTVGSKGIRDWADCMEPVARRNMHLVADEVRSMELRRRAAMGGHLADAGGRRDGSY